MPDLDQIKQGKQGARDRRLQELEEGSKARAAACLSTTDRKVFAADLLLMQQRETIGSILDCRSRSCHWQDGMLFAIIREVKAEITNRS